MIAVPGILIVSFLFIVAITIQTSQSILFDTRELTEREKQIAEKDYLSIVEKCYGRLEAKENSGEMCDAFLAYYLNQCAALDNLLSYCAIDFTRITL